MGQHHLQASSADPGSHRPQWLPDPPPGQDGGNDRRPPLDDWLQQRLFDQRVILVHGYLDSDQATRVAAQLVALDSLGGHRITVHMDCPNADLGAALLLIDTIDSLHVPIHAIATGSVGGAALGVLASAHHRTAFPHARFQLVEPRAGDNLSGTADRLVSQSEAHEEMLTSLVHRIARVAVKAPENIRGDLRDGKYLTALQAVEYGLVETVASSADRYGAGSGFRPGDG
jgi:ATP-dependent Clp protease, protease subunit